MKEKNNMNNKGEAVTGFVLTLALCTFLFMRAYDKGYIKEPNWKGPKKTIDTYVPEIHDNGGIGVLGYF